VGDCFVAKSNGSYPKEAREKTKTATFTSSVLNTVQGRGEREVRTKTKKTILSVLKQRKRGASRAVRYGKVLAENTQHYTYIKNKDDGDRKIQGNSYFGGDEAGEKNLEGGIFPTVRGPGKDWNQGKLGGLKARKGECRGKREGEKNGKTTTLSKNVKKCPERWGYEINNPTAVIMLKEGRYSKNRDANDSGPWFKWGGELKRKKEMRGAEGKNSGVFIIMAFSRCLGGRRNKHPLRKLRERRKKRTRHKTEKEKCGDCGCRRRRDLRPERRIFENTEVQGGGAFRGVMSKGNGMKKSVRNVVGGRKKTEKNKDKASWRNWRVVLELLIDILPFKGRERRERL